MASHLRTPTLGLTGLSMCLCLAIIGTAGRSLHIFYTHQSTNLWFLPLWPNHFDVRELQTLIGTAGAIFVLNAVLAVGLLVPSLPANGIVAGSALLSTAVAVIAIVFPTVLNYRAPTTDTLKTWSCRWSDIIDTGEGPPMQFLGLCYKTRFAYYTTIPVFVLQVALLALGIYALFSRRPGRLYIGHPHDLEKLSGEGDAHPLRNVGSARNNVSFETRAESPQSYQPGRFQRGVSKR